MNHLFASLILAANLGDPGTIPQPTAVEQKSSEQVTVYRAIDGDTVQLDDGRRVRLAGIDAPEKSGDQPYWSESKQLLQKLCGGYKLLQFRDTGQGGWGRELGDLYYTKGGRRYSIARTMVRSGGAWYWDKYGGRDRAELAKMHQQAQAERRGLWATSNPLAPWEWRKGTRSKPAAAAPRGGGSLYQQRGLQLPSVFRDNCPGGS